MNYSRALKPDDFAVFCRLAAEVHAGQKDKAGEPYLLHPLRVGLALLPDVEAACVGVCHDVLEDCELVHQEALLQLCRQYPRKMKAALLRLTRHPRGSYADYIERLAATPDLSVRDLACRVKIADLEDNLQPDRIAAAAGNGHTIQVERYRAALSRMNDTLSRSRTEVAG